MLGKSVESITDLLPENVAALEAWNHTTNSSNYNSSSYDAVEGGQWNMANPQIQTFATYAIPIIVVFGIWGNSISLIVLKNSAQKSAAHLYLCCLSIFDSITLVSIIFSIWGGVVLRGHVTVHGCNCNCCWQPLVQFVQVMRSLHFCRGRVYLSFVARTVSTWTIVAFSWQRCFAIIRPLHLVEGNGLRNARNTLIGIVLAAGVSNSFVIFGYDNDNGQCRSNEIFLQGRVFALLLQSIIPWLLILIANGIIICQMQRAAVRGSRRQAENKSLTEKETHGVQIGTRTQRKQRRGVTYRLVVVSIVFLVTTVWVTVATAWKSWSSSSPSSFRDNLWILSFVPFTLNFGINFVLYCLVGKKFRRVTVLLLTCRWSQMREARRLLDPSRPASAARVASIDHN